MDKSKLYVYKECFLFIVDCLNKVAVEVTLVF